MVILQNLAKVTEPATFVTNTITRHYVINNLTTTLTVVVAKVVTQHLSDLTLRAKPLKHVVVVILRHSHTPILLNNSNNRNQYLLKGKTTHPKPQVPPLYQLPSLTCWIAQLVAHQPRILRVGGSCPGRGVNNVRLSTKRLLLWVAPQWWGWGYPA